MVANVADVTSRSLSSSSSSRSISSISSTSSTSTSSTTTGQDRSIIRTDGGSVAVQRRDSALEIVDVTTADGWSADRTSDDEQTLVVVFTRASARVDVTISMSATGITSAVSSSSIS